MGTFNVTANLQARASYGRTLGRPNLGSIIPGVTIPEPSIGVVREVIAVTNTALQPWTANNYDLTLESYNFKDGFGSVGIFQKNIKEISLLLNTVHGTKLKKQDTKLYVLS